MNKLKKVISVGMSAALLASLLATAVAPSVFAATTSTSVAKAVPISGASTTAIGASLTLSAAGDVSVATGIVLSITGPFNFDTTSTVTAAAGATGTVFGATTMGLTSVTIAVTTANTAAGTITFSGLKVKATTAAIPSSTGTIVATTAGGAPVIATLTILTQDLGVTVTGAGNVAVTGTTGAVSISVTEPSEWGWSTLVNTVTFTLNDAAGGTGTVAWSGTPVISGAPGSLGTFTVTKSAAALTVSFTTSNQTQVENFSITGLTIDTTAAPSGALRIIVSGAFGSTGAGAVGTAIAPTGVTTASGVLAADTAAPSTTVVVTMDTGSYPFVATDADNGNAQIAAPNAENLSIGSVAGTTTETLDFSGAITTASFHAKDTAVSQSVSVLGLVTGIGTVVATLNETAVVASVFPQPGESNNSLTGASVALTETNAGTLATNAVVTFTLSAAGVVFSTPPTATPSGASMRLNGAAVGVGVPCTLSFDRTSCSVTVTTKSAVASVLSLSAISVDVAVSVLQGTKVDVNITTSPAVPVNVVSKTIATVARIAVGVAAQPTIYINENDQSTGVITLTESRAGILTAAAGTNYFGICLASTGATFTRAPWATVTTGDLKIRSGVVGAVTVQGSLFSSTCVTWVIYSASTVASTIEIRGADATNVILPAGATNGPRVSLSSSAVPGANAVRVLNGSQAGVEGNTALVTIVSNAVHAFRNQPVVAAVSQPLVPKGSTNSLAGCLTITETQAGQFKPTEGITVTILARSSVNAAFQARQDIFLKTGTTADLPLVTTNTASGLLAGPATTGQTTISFSVNQQATGTLGVITVCNIHLITLADALDGAILVRVQGSGGSSVVIDQVVSIGTIGNAAADAWIAKGLNVRAASAFGLATAVTKRGIYVTVRARIASAAPGTLVQIWVKTKTTAWKLESNRRVSTDGYMYYSGKVLNLGYRYYRVNALGVTSNTVRGYGK